MRRRRKKSCLRRWEKTSARNLQPTRAPLSLPSFAQRAGDVFTRVTIVVAAVWILLCAAAVKMFKTPDDIADLLRIAESLEPRA